MHVIAFHPTQIARPLNASPCRSVGAVHNDWMLRSQFVSRQSRQELMRVNTRHGVSLIGANAPNQVVRCRCFCGCRCCRLPLVVVGAKIVAYHSRPQLDECRLRSSRAAFCADRPVSARVVQSRRGSCLVVVLGRRGAEPRTDCGIDCGVIWWFFSAASTSCHFVVAVVAVVVWGTVRLVSLCSCRCCHHRGSTFSFSDCE